MQLRGEDKHVKNYYRTSFGKSGSKIYKTTKDRDTKVSADRKIPDEFSMDDPFSSIFAEIGEANSKYRLRDGILSAGPVSTGGTAAITTSLHHTDFIYATFFL